MCLAWPAGLNATVTFTFNYQDFTGSGFNDFSEGATRRAALEQAASVLGGYFQNNAVVTMDVSSFTYAGSGTLATAGSDLSFSGAGFFNTVAQEKIVSSGATDVNGSAADGTMVFNFGQPWDYSDSVSASAYDFKSTVMHEIAHALGFLSFISPSGQGKLNSPSGSPDAWSQYDNWLTDNTGAALINDSTFAFDPALLGTLTGGSANGVFFGGPNAMAAYGGQLVPIYSPDPYEYGSSGSHTDDNTFSGANQLLMNAALETGPGVRTLSAIELGIFQDLGYTVAVPEPGVAALLLAGLFGWAGRSRQRAV